MLKITTGFLIALSLLFVPAAFADAPSATPRVLELSGHGEVKITPNIAVVEMGVLSQAKMAKDAVDANTIKMAALIAMLKTAGVDEKDIQTSSFSVNPQYEHGNNSGAPPKIAGYDVGNSVTITLRKLADLGTILSKAVDSGSNHIDNVTMSVANPEAAMDEARKTAVKDAMRKAKVLTDAAGVKLGPLMSMTDLSGEGPMPMASARMMTASSSKASAMIPTAQGQVAISADVNLMWQLE